MTLNQHQQQPPGLSADVQSQLNRHAQRHAVAIIIAPPPSVGGVLNTSSGCILGLDGRVYLLTANHVLDSFERRVVEDSAVRWQVSFPAGADHRLVFDPRGRVRSRSRDQDVVAIELTQQEPEQVGAPICSTPLGWPPPIPTAGDYVAISGYPAMYREREGDRRIIFPALSGVFEVTTSGQYHLVTQWERDRIVSLGGPDVPSPGAELGGMSGGPVFLVRDLVYPLIGVITEFQTPFELLRMAHVGSLQLP
jgi:hypothetical protein